MRELLVSYLLGELDAQRTAEIEAKIACDPQLKKQLEHLRSCMALEDSCEEPPSGLADRTADSVHDLVLGLSSGGLSSGGLSSGGLSSGGLSSEGLSSEGIGSTDGVDPPKCASRFTLVDAAVAGGVVMALGMMLLPALQECRQVSQRTACENNMREVGLALAAYSNDHGNLAPHVHPGENAGMFAVRLADGGFAKRDLLGSWLVCPSSSLNEEVADGRIVAVVPRASNLRNLNAEALAEARRVMGGSYAYRLGYLDGKLYLPIKHDQQKSYSPMLSDAPHPSSGKWQSANHGGYGQNVLYQDGHVRYAQDSYLPTLEDNLFTNSAGIPAAGRRWNDAVLVRSEVTPGVLPAAQTPRSEPRGIKRFRATILRFKTEPLNAQRPANGSAEP